MRFRSFFVHQSNDFTWIGATHGIWGQAEPAAYLVCACVITFKPLFDAVFWKGKRRSGEEALVPKTGELGRDQEVGSRKEEEVQGNGG